MAITILFIFLLTNFLGNGERITLIKNIESDSPICYFIDYLKSTQEKKHENKIHLKVPNIYNPHPPIYINGNENFTQENGVVGGNGTKENPYIIEGWEINASSSDTILQSTILIRNSTNCALIGNDVSYNGVTFYETKNCSIIGNMMDNPFLSLIYTTNASVYNNIIKNNYIGIALYNSKNCTIIKNILRENKEGLLLHYSVNCIIKNDTMINNGIVLGGSSLKYWNTHEIDTTNTVNGKPVYYWKNVNEGIVPSGAGQVILANCSNVIIKNQNISNATVGIGIGYSTNCNIVNNVVTKSIAGTILYNSTSCIIDGCILSNNNGGILLSNAKKSKVINSNIFYSNITGIIVSDSDENNISNCNISYNLQGIEISWASSNHVEHNIFYNNSEALSMQSALYDKILGNIFHENVKGISMSWVNLANISQNKCHNNDIAISI